MRIEDPDPHTIFNTGELRHGSLTRQPWITIKERYMLFDVNDVVTNFNKTVTFMVDYRPVMIAHPAERAGRFPTFLSRLCNSHIPNTGFDVIIEICNIPLWKWL